jgi:hypothetical protein
MGGLANRRERRRVHSLFGAFVIALIMVSSSVFVMFSIVSPNVSAAGWNIQVLAGGSGDQAAGFFPSLKLDSLGRPHIAFGAAKPGGYELRYASWTGSTWQFETADPSVILGEKVSLALDSQDQPHVAYRDEVNQVLKYSHKEGGIWYYEVVDNQGNVGYQPSLAIDSLDRPHIAYQWVAPLAVNWSIRYAIHNGTGWDISTLSSLDTFGSYTGQFGLSLALDSSDRPRIAYSNYALHFAYWSGSSWVDEVVEHIIGGGETGDLPSMVLDSTQTPHVSFRRVTPDDRLEYATRGLLGWMAQSVDYPWRGTYSSIAVDTLNRPHIAYTAGEHNTPPPLLYYAEWNGMSWVLATVDTQEGTWYPLSIAVDGCDGVHIAYEWINATASELRYAYRGGLDATPPSSSATLTGMYWRNSSPLVVDASASDSCSGVASVTLWYRQSVDNSTWGLWTQYSTLASAPWSWSFTFPDGEGYYEFYTTSVDNVGNTEPPPLSADSIAGYDITPPVSAALPTSPYWYSSPPMVVNATATDSLSGVAEVTMLYSYAPLDNSSWTLWTPLETKTAGPWSWTFPFPDGEGHYKFHTIARDVARNVEGRKDYAEAIAGYRVPPDYAPVSLLPSSPATIGLSLPLQMSIEVLNAGGFENVTSTLAFYNESRPSSPFFTAEIPSIPAGIISGPFTANWTSPATPCTCRVVANVDYYDNMTESNETNNNYTWTFNVVPGPVTSLVIGQPNYIAATAYVRSSTPLDLSALDQSSSGINHTWYRIDNVTWIEHSFSFFLSGEGNHYVEYYSEDNVGNVEDISWRVLRVDNTPPATTLSIGDPKYLVGGNFTKSSTPLTLHADDGGLMPVGTNSTFYRLWNGTWSQWREYTSSFSLVGRDGMWFVEFLSFDFLGNREAVQNVTLVLDNAAPSLSIDPEESTVLVNTHFTISADDGQGSGVASVEYRTDGGDWTPYSSSFTLGIGHHLIEYRSSDNLNNSVEKSLPVEVVGSETPPEGRVEFNYKPLVALLFSVILIFAAAYSARKRPLPWGNGQRKRFLLSWAVLALPFISAEAATGLISIYFEPLRIPPLVGWGTGVDSAILAVGLLFSLLRTTRKSLGDKEKSAV